MIKVNIYITISIIDIHGCILVLPVREDGIKQDIKAIQLYKRTGTNWIKFNACIYIMNDTYCPIHVTTTAPSPAFDGVLIRSHCIFSTVFGLEDSVIAASALPNLASNSILIMSRAVGWCADSQGFSTLTTGQLLLCINVWCLHTETIAMVVIAIGRLVSSSDSSRLCHRRKLIKIKTCSRSNDGKSKFTSKLE